MSNLTEITNYCDDYLAIAKIADYPQAENGLQVANDKNIQRIAMAVDASINIIDQCIDENVDLLLVHHGLFWHKPTKLINNWYRKINKLIKHDIAVYSAHIPLDIHAKIGNNQLLCQALQLTNIEPFLPWKNQYMGLQSYQADMSIETLLKRVQQQVGAAHLIRGSRSNVGNIGVITGGAGSQIVDVIAAGINTFITGEGPHWSYAIAQEHDIHVIYAGHYATEVFGVRALGQLLATKFQLSSIFLDDPSGL